MTFATSLSTFSSCRLAAAALAIAVVPLASCQPAPTEISDNVEPGAATTDGTASDLAAFPPARDLFIDRAAELGLDFVHYNGMTDRYYLAEMTGGGGALVDIDGDADLDVYLVQGNLLEPGSDYDDTRSPPHGPRPPTDRLYRNELVETGHLRFTDISADASLEPGEYGMGVAAGDIDNDGDADLYITGLGSNRLLRNDGGTFTDITTAAGVDDRRWSTAALFADLDGDGWLDLYVANYVDFTVASHKACYSDTSAQDYCSPLSYDPYPDRLLRNRGNGTFADISTNSRIVTEFGGALGVVASDFNSDGRLDLYVANDGMANQLWINQGDGTFQNEALLAGVAFNEDGQAEASMGVDAADFDGDGDEDLFMAHLSDETHTLYANDGRGLFEDVSMESRLAVASRAYTGFGTAWLDIDNDSWLDLLIVNGAVKTVVAQARAGDSLPLNQTNQLFRNQGDGRFADITAQAGAVFELSEVSRGAAFGDIDNDGDSDVLVINNNGPARLLINQIGQDRPWLGLRLLSRHGRDAYGARVACRRDDGRILWRRVRADGSYLSANDPRVLCGLGEGHKASSVRVEWPGGNVESWDASAWALGEYRTLAEGEGTAVETDR